MGYLTVHNWRSDMRIFERINSQLQRAVLLGAALAAVASMPPLHLAQRIDSALLAEFTDWLPGTQTEIVIVNVAEFDALPALAPGANATIVSPTAIALGPMQRPDWAAAIFWLLAIGCVYSLLASQGRSRLHCWLLALAAPAALLLISGTALAAASIWIPVATPALFLLATGTAALQARAASAPPTAIAVLAGRAAGNAGLVDRWQTARTLPVTADLMPELKALADELSTNSQSQLAADLYLRIAQVDPDFENVSQRLVCSRVGCGPEQDELRKRLRAEMPGQIERYRLLEPIGQGATGRVYLAWDPKIRRLVAIKFIDLSLERDEIEVKDAKSRFLREAELTGQLTHPSIVTVHDVGEFEGRAYFALEYLNGDVLSRLTTADNRLLPVHLTLELGALVADALDYAHNRNVIHRDIKPANIMYDSVSGDLKVTDFGIARPINVNRTRTGIVLGTPSFMSPEQIEGRNVKGHTDLFALGVSLYELLTGELPFRGNSMTDLMFVIANEPHQPVSEAKPGLSAVLDPFFDHALQKDPSDRFASGADMAAELRALAGQLN